MRVLVPLPFDISCRAHGRNLRIIHLLGELRDRCDITLAVPDATSAHAARDAVGGVRVLASPDTPERRDARAAALPGPWRLRRAAEFFGYDPALRAWTDRLSADADVVLGFDLHSACYLTQLGHHGGRPVPAICDLIDDPWLTFRSSGWQEQFSTRGMKTAVAVRTLRKLLLPHIDMLLAVAPGDARLLARTTGRQVRVVPNGVELPATLPSQADREPLIVLTGAMSFPPNIQAARYLVRAVWPRVRRMLPDARLALVGADPAPQVQALAGEPGVRVTGRVEDLAAWLRRARVATAPMLSGTGLKNKILEACAQGCPVVATGLAVNGIPAGEEHGILVADDPAAFAACLVRLLCDPQAAHAVGRAGWNMVRERFSWPGAAAMLWSAIREAAGAMPAAACGIEPAAAPFESSAPSGKEVTTHAPA